MKRQQSIKSLLYLPLLISWLSMLFLLCLHIIHRPENKIDREPWGRGHYQQGMHQKILRTRFCLPFTNGWALL